MGKLFTAHDPLNVHKTLGGVAVLHALYRLCNVGQTDMGFDGSLCTLACMTWHATLSCSSLIFRIPKHRLMSAGQAGSMIWPEYRLHSILFAVRSLLCMAIVWVEARVGGVMSDPIRVHTVVNIGFVFATLWTATAISRALPSGAAGSKNPTDAPGGTIRDLEAPSWMKTFFSNMQVKLSSACFPHAPISMRNLPDFTSHLMQFHLTAICLVGVSRFSLNFMSVFIIQVKRRVCEQGNASAITTATTDSRLTRATYSRNQHFDRVSVYGVSHDPSAQEPGTPPADRRHVRSDAGLRFLCNHVRPNTRGRDVGTWQARALTYHCHSPALHCDCCAGLFFPVPHIGQLRFPAQAWRPLVQVLRLGR
jgi:hypothetical protein